MQGIVFYLLLPFVYLISLLPFPILYLVSDLMYVVFYYLIQYRRKVVTENLQRSFPEKTKAELTKLSKKYFHYLCDLILETFKTLTISEKEAVKRCMFHSSTYELIEKLYHQQKSIILVMGHYGNWEWAGSTMSLVSNYQLYVIYRPLRNEHFNQLIYKMRTRFGTKLISMNHTLREMIANRHVLSATAFIADQTPAPESAYWTKFLHQDTAVFLGTEKIARKLNYPVVFVDIKRKKRGYYEIFTELLFEKPAETKEGEITETYINRLEQEIVKQPELWLWSHRRWKHKKPPV